MCNQVSLLERVGGLLSKGTHSEARVEEAHQDTVFLVGDDDGDALRSELGISAPFR